MDDNSKNNLAALAGASPGSGPKSAAGAAMEKETQLRPAPKPRRAVPAKRSSEEIKDHIGRQLKTVYNDVLRQPIPDRFTDLIRQLKAKEEGKE